MPDVVCLGILVADVVARPVEELPRGALALMDEVSLHGGGCALNTATGLARLGLDVAVAGKVGDDPLGDFLVGCSDDRGIDRTAVVRARGADIGDRRAGRRSERAHIPPSPGANAELRAESSTGTHSSPAARSTSPALS